MKSSYPSKSDCKVGSHAREMGLMSCLHLSFYQGKNLLRSSYLKGQCPDYAHAPASSVFSSKDNRTVLLTRQDFLPDRTADGDLLFIFSSNILDF